MVWFVRRVLLIAWPVVEILLLWYVAGLIGWGWVLLILFCGVVAAVALLQAAGRNVWQVMADPRRRGQTFTTVDPDTGEATTLYQPPVEGDDSRRADELKVRESGLLVTAAALLAIPGFVSDAVGVLLILPPVRRALARRGAARGRAAVTVVRGETVEPTQTSPGARPPGGTVISGEILPPPEDPAP